MTAIYKTAAKKVMYIFFISIIITIFYNFFLREKVNDYFFNSGVYQYIRNNYVLISGNITSKLILPPTKKVDQKIQLPIAVAAQEAIVNGVRHSLILKIYDFIPILQNLDIRKKEDGPGYRASIGYIQNINETYLMILSAYGNLYFFNKKMELLKTLNLI